MKKHAAVYGDTMGCTDISTYFWCGFVRKQYISISHINCFLYPYHSIHIPYQLFFCHIPWEKLVFETLNFQTRPAGQAEESDLLHAPGRMWCVQRRRKTGQRVNGEHVIGFCLPLEGLTECHRSQSKVEVSSRQRSSREVAKKIF